MNFNKKANSYDQNADFQRKTSDRLFHSLCSIKPVKIKRILEIGCGTGYLTEKLRHRFPEASIEALDLSEEMVKKVNSKKLDKVIAILANAEDFIATHKYDLIVSNLAFQWFNDQSGTINKLTDSLTKNGSLLINTLVEGTYEKFIAAFTENSLPYPGLEYISKHELQETLTQTAIINKYLIKENFPNTRTFLKKLHAIGAHKSKSLSTKDLRRVIKTHDSFFTGEIQVEYQVLELTITKGTQC